MTGSFNQTFHNRVKSSSHAVLPTVDGGAGKLICARSVGADSFYGGLIVVDSIKVWLSSEWGNGEDVSDSRLNLDFHAVDLANA